MDEMENETGEELIEELNEDLNETLKDSIDYVLGNMLSNLLDFVKVQKEIHVGTEKGRQVSILYTEIEKVYAWFMFMDSLDYDDDEGELE
jgi:DNA mismatch repair ATPase MutS